MPDPRQDTDPISPKTIGPPPDAATIQHSLAGESAHTMDHVVTAETDDAPASEVTAISKKAQRLAQVKIPGYEILSELGHGGMGVVYKARDLRLDRPVALKMVLAGVHASDQVLARFFEEARAVAKFEHPNIVHIYEINDVDGLPYFSLEYVEGGSLDRRINHKPQAPLFAATTVETLARAMQYAHDRGVIHRDLKPGNVLLTKDGQPKVADFSLAKQAQGSSHTQAGQVMGTPSYMAPEQARADMAAIGPACDQFALGGILYACLTGRPPFNGATTVETLDQVRNLDPAPPSQLNQNVPRDLETICLKCLQKDTAKRYASCAELADDLRRYLDGRPIIARPVSAWERSLRWTKRNPTIAALVVGVAILLLTVTVVSSSSWLTIRGQNRKLLASAETINVQNAELIEKAEIERNLRLESDRHLDQFRKSTDLLVNQIPAKLEGAIYLRKTVEDVLSMIDDVRGQTDLTSADRHIQVRAKQAKLLSEGKALLEKKNYAQAIAKFDESRAIAQQVVDDNPRDKDKSAGNLAVSLARLGEAWFVQGNLAKGREYFEKALTIRRRIVLQPESNELPERETRASLADSLARLAEVLDSSGDHQSALPYAVEAVQVMEKVDPKELGVGQRLTLGSSLAGLGRVRFLTNDYAGGRAAYDRAFAELRTLVKEQPLNLGYQQLLARRASDAGDFELMYANDAARAHARYKEAVSVFGPLTDPPEVNALRRELSLHQYKNAAAALKSGDRAAADKQFRASLELRQALYKTSPQNLLLKDELMLAQARCGLHFDAAVIAKEFEEIADLQTVGLAKARFLKLAAFGLALCANAAIDNRAGPPPLAAHQQRREYLDRALTDLERAVSLGYSNVDELRRDPDFDPLRGEERFKALIEKLEIK
jgi:serine/threonine protein kinase